MNVDFVEYHRKCNISYIFIILIVRLQVFCYFKYDFICILRPLLNDKIIEFVKKNNKELFVYGNYNNNFKYDFPYYIVD